MKAAGLRTKRIGVLMGGRSAEREVSLRSGAAVLQAMKLRGYAAQGIDAAEDLCAVLRKKKMEAAFLALHGGHGENGAVQGLLEVMGIPYTGSGVLASALAMDKEASKIVFRHHGIPVPESLTVIRGRTGARGGFSARRIGFSLPWVVKPATEGSSVGVEIVRERKAAGPALERAFGFGERVIVERYVAGKEIQIGILNNEVLGGVEVRPSLEFYNYEAKYTAGLTEYIIPPGIGRKEYRQAAAAALAGHRALGCRGATRVDLIVDDEGSPFVLEVNTIPGMTETSLLPKIAKAAGLDFPMLIERILEGIEGED